MNLIWGIIMPDNLKIFIYNPGLWVVFGIIAIQSYEKLGDKL